MKATASRRKRYRLLKFLIPGYIALYAAMIPLNDMLETEHAEIFPFFSFELFSRVPDWTTSEYGLIIEAVNGQPAQDNHYLIPSGDVQDWKALRQAGQACAKDLDCDETVSEVLYPIIEGSLGNRNIDFRIVIGEIDLRDIRDGLDEIEAGTAQRTDFFSQVELVGRWNTTSGRLGPPVGAK